MQIDQKCCLFCYMLLSCIFYFIYTLLKCFGNIVTTKQTFNGDARTDQKVSEIECRKHTFVNLRTCFLFFATFHFFDIRFKIKFGNLCCEYKTLILIQHIMKRRIQLVIPTMMTQTHQHIVIDLE